MIQPCSGRGGGRDWTPGGVVSKGQSCVAARTTGVDLSRTSCRIAESFPLFKSAASELMCERYSCCVGWDNFGWKVSSLAGRADVWRCGTGF
jgi:hypothetical protein